MATATSPTTALPNPKITFAEEVRPSELNPSDDPDRTARKMSSASGNSTRKWSSGSSNDERLRRLSNNSSIPEDAILDDRDHKQDWTKITAERDTWAHQERRRLSGWSNTAVNAHKNMDGSRRGSVLSMWAPGKDAEGNDILMHNDERGEAEIKNPRQPANLMPGSPTKGSVRRLSNNSEPRRGSILSLWKGGKDANGNDILGGDDEEWAR